MIKKVYINDLRVIVVFFPKGNIIDIHCEKFDNRQTASKSIFKSTVLFGLGGYYGS